MARQQRPLLRPMQRGARHSSATVAKPRHRVSISRADRSRFACEPRRPLQTMPTPRQKRRSWIGGTRMRAAGVIHSMKAVILATAALAAVIGSARAESALHRTIRRANWAQGLLAVALYTMAH